MDGSPHEYIRPAHSVVLALLILARFLLTLTHLSGIEKVPGPNYPSWLTGNFKQVFNPSAWGFHEFLAKKYGSIVRLQGPYGTKALYIFDAKAMHTVLVKDQDVFEENEGFIQSNLLIFGDGLLGALGDRHRKQRKMLNPVFSAAHMREMTPTFFDVTHKLERALKDRLQKGPSIQEVDILSWMGRTALEIIGQAGLGYSFDPLTDEESSHPYSKMIKELLPTLMRVQFWRLNVLPYVSWIGTAKFRRFVVNLLPWKDLHHLRDMVDYMHNVAEEIYENKRRAFEMGDEAVDQQIGRGKDLISILMRENMKASTEDRLQDIEVIGQMNTLIFAAMDTTSSAMSRLLHILSKHPDVQDRLRRELLEIKRQKNGQDLSYDELNSLPYLDAICRETLRLYSPASSIVRVARQDAVIHLHKPIHDSNGIEMHEVAVPRGTTIFVSIFNANRNPDLWDAGEWRPERWLAPLPESLINARIPGVYSHLMTFIGGGRSCIGFKFSQLEMKVVISILVESFKFSPSDKEAEVFWQMNGATAPVVGKDNHPRLPINITSVS
ncbi:cytochrome P450 [Lentinula edodes]|uniref:cytochrome P450 n=1 Tax=Lentinula edodes TaxID=5353 RepID=UPI001E8E46EA|nr:cytochrome P450 [Lentinula edodes]KAH7874006.1 cytochrome P450 [Lentinula edodes]